MNICSDDKKYVYNNVRRWTSEMRLGRWGQPSKKITECDKLIIPVHLGCHWTCAVISLRDQEILYFDSLGVSCFVCCYVGQLSCVLAPFTDILLFKVVCNVGLERQLDSPPLLACFAWRGRISSRMLSANPSLGCFPSWLGIDTLEPLCGAWPLDVRQKTAQVLALGAYAVMGMSVMQGKEHEIIESLAKYVTDEYQNKCQETVDTSKWPRRYNVCLLVS